MKSIHVIRGTTPCCDKPFSITYGNVRPQIVICVEHLTSWNVGGAEPQLKPHSGDKSKKSKDVNSNRTTKE